MIYCCCNLFTSDLVVLGRFQVMFLKCSCNYLYVILILDWISHILSQYQHHSTRIYIFCRREGYKFCRIVFLNIFIIIVPFLCFSSRRSASIFWWKCLRISRRYDLLCLGILLRKSNCGFFWRNHSHVTKFYVDIIVNCFSDYFAFFLFFFVCTFSCSTFWLYASFITWEMFVSRLVSVRLVFCFCLSPGPHRQRSFAACISVQFY